MGLGRRADKSWIVCESEDIYIERYNCCNYNTRYAYNVSDRFAIKFLSLPLQVHSLVYVLSSLTFFVVSHLLHFLEGPQN